MTARELVEEHGYIMAQLTESSDRVPCAEVLVTPSLDTPIFHNGVKVDLAEVEVEVEPEYGCHARVTNMQDENGAWRYQNIHGQDLRDITLYQNNELYITLEDALRAYGVVLEEEGVQP